jgi:hypothetical protein
VAAPAAPPAVAPPAERAPGEPGGRLTLDVLVYSDSPAERFVFISGRKYVEGQTISEGVVLERITAEGAVVREGEQRIVLRPRLNPLQRRSP